MSTERTLTSRKALVGRKGTPLQPPTPDLPLPGPGKLLLACGRRGTIRFLPDGKRLLFSCPTSGLHWVLRARPSTVRSSRRWKALKRRRGDCRRCANLREVSR